MRQSRIGVDRIAAQREGVGVRTRRESVHARPYCDECLGDGRGRQWSDTEAELSDRERDLLVLLAQGLTDDVVAKRLCVSVRTERRMVAELMRRLGASGRFEAGVKAVRRSWI
ncbi:helix-turn-helix transcriptional regulator [Kitasatospora cinereorecta]|uniref:Response regulator transcription factor n=1 Tax=Kitasatospora cinereorecta TaxID=285560 RepID=A0ABW0VBS8_9ACTN